MKILSLLLISQALFAVEPSLKKKAALDFPSKSVMIIDPKQRAEDYIQAFDLLKREKSAEKIMIRTPQNTYMNVSEIHLSKGGTLLMIKTPSNLGSKTQVIPVEEVVEIGYGL